MILYEQLQINTEEKLNENVKNDHGFNCAGKYTNFVRLWL